MRTRSWAAVAASVALAGGAWVVSRTSSPDAATPRIAVSMPPAADSVAMAPPVPSASAASTVAAQPSPLPQPAHQDSAADLLRKVQLGFGGSALQAQEAANVLQSCAHAAESADSLQTVRETWSMVPKFIRKFIDSLGGITDEHVERAQADARRCQVFDEATLARRGELFEKAHEGGAPGSTMPYLTWLTHDGRMQADPAVVENLQAELRQLAQGGDFGTLMAFAFTLDPQPYGASPMEREAYKQAWLRIVEDGGPGSGASSRELIAKLERLAHVAPLTDQQQQEVQAMAQKVYDEFRRRSR